MSFGTGDFGGDGNNSFSTYHGSAGRSSGASDFNRLSQSIANNIHKITQNVSEIETYTTRLGTHEDNKGLRAKLDEVSHYTNQLAKDTNRMLKDLNSIPPPYNPSDHKPQRIQRERLTNDFTSALNQFQRAQRDAASKERDSYDKIRGGPASAGYEDTAGDTLMGFEGSKADQGYSQQSQFSYEDFDAIQERETQLKKLESDILDVNQIFKDLATMVHEQGEVIDSIEANVESAEVHVEQANTQLEQARTMQKKARRKKFLLVICCLVLALVIALILYFTLRPN